MIWTKLVSIFLYVYLERCRRSIKVAANKVWQGKVDGVRRPKSKPRSFLANWSRHHRTSSQVWRKGEGGQSREVDQLVKLPMLTATLLSSSTNDFELTPQSKSKDNHWAISSSTCLVAILRLENALGAAAAAICRVSRACTWPSTKGPRSAGGAPDETSIPKSLCVKTLCQFPSSCFSNGLPSFKISGHFDPGNRSHLPKEVFTQPPQLHLPCLEHRTLSSSLSTDSWDIRGDSSNSSDLILLFLFVLCCVNVVWGGLFSQIGSFVRRVARCWRRLLIESSPASGSLTQQLKLCSFEIFRLKQNKSNEIKNWGLRPQCIIVMINWGLQTEVQ